MGKRCRFLCWRMSLIGEPDPTSPGHALGGSCSAGARRTGMLIGVPKEIKVDESRVGLIPATVRELVARGHQVVIETRAGEGAGIDDEDYAASGARIVASADE